MKASSTVVDIPVRGRAAPTHQPHDHEPDLEPAMDEADAAYDEVDEHHEDYEDDAPPRNRKALYLLIGAGVLCGGLAIVAVVGVLTEGSPPPTAQTRVAPTFTPAPAQPGQGLQAIPPGGAPGQSAQNLQPAPADVQQPYPARPAPPDPAVEQLHRDTAGFADDLAILGPLVHRLEQAKPDLAQITADVHSLLDGQKKLDERMAALEAKTSQTKPAPVARRQVGTAVEAPIRAATPAAPATAAIAPTPQVTRKAADPAPAHVAQPPTPVHWTIGGISQDIAVLRDPTGQQAPLVVRRNDPIPGYGKVVEIGQLNGHWTVITDGGRIEN